MRDPNAPKRLPGRALRPAEIERFLDRVARGETVTQACRALGIGYETIYRRLRYGHSEYDPEFARRYDEATAWQIPEVEDALFARAKAGNVPAIGLFLSNRASDRYSLRPELAPARGIASRDGEIRQPPVALSAAAKSQIFEIVRRELLGADAAPAGGEETVEAELVEAPEVSRDN